MATYEVKFIDETAFRDSDKEWAHLVEAESAAEAIENTKNWLKNAAITRAAYHQFSIDRVEITDDSVIVYECDLLTASGKNTIIYDSFHATLIPEEPYDEEDEANMAWIKINITNK